MGEQRKEKRLAIARKKLIELYHDGEKEGVDYFEAESAPFFFIGHHLDEIEPEYWQSQFGKIKPEVIEILEKLQLVGNWSYEDDDDLNVFDFSLPGEITNYVLAVVFDKNDNVEDIMMES